MRRLNVYIAGPLFNEAERSRNRDLRSELERYVDVYLPQEDGALLVDLVASGVEISVAKNYVFRNDIDAIRRADALIILMDGRSIDEGACFELGFAYSLQKICVGLKTDARSLLTHGDNPMIEGALSRIFRRDAELFDWLRNTTTNRHIMT